MPIQFDENEWYIILNIVFGYLWVIFAPKRYPRSISILAVLFCVSIAIILDHSIATPPLDLYDINDRKSYELFDAITYFMYTPFALLSVYLYDKYNPKGLYYTAYVVGWSLLAVFFEWLAVKCHVFTYNKWTLLYSFAVYIVATPLQLAFFRYTLKYFNDNRQKFNDHPDVD
jgi:hypothetical protein